MGRAYQRLKDITTNELKVDYPDTHIQITWKQAVAGAVAAIVVAVALWLRQPHASPPSVSEFASTTSAVSAQPTVLVVSVVGAVEHPGLHTFAPGARIADALDAAQPQEGAQLLALNLAEHLQDAQQIYLPPAEASPAESGVFAETGPAETGPAQAGVSLNKADVATLMTLPGVGQKTAEAIVAYREQHGGFKNIEELQQVKGIGPAKYAQIAPEVHI